MEKKRILIVEDEPRIALALCRALEFPGHGNYQVEISPVAETALAKLESGRFDLIITDMRMPGMGGLEFIRHVRQTSPQTHTMLITAFGSSEIEELTQRLGATYLPKPFSMREFVETAKRILSGRAPEADTVLIVGPDQNLDTGEEPTL